MALPHYTRLENIQYALDDVRETLAIWRDHKDDDDPYIVKLYAEFDELVVQKQNMLKKVVPFTAVYRDKEGAIIAERTYYGNTLMDAEGLALDDADEVTHLRGRATTITMYSMIEASKLNVEV